uniref:Uncharacterized protein LOC113791382 n=1 Tax=Dermatophagoides pteronyssinus TaxID=6956 RepID=A0A6P6XVR6_DERPT|nr:uncharacterized protein LOC113791382 [Dermatophagoides pteronyssinus]
MIPYKNVNYMQSYLHYQNEIANNPESEANRLFKRSIWLQMYQLIRYFFLFLLPLNQVQRTLVYDIFFLLGLHSSINSIGMFLTALGMFLSYKLYIEIPENIIRLMNMILFNSNDCLIFDLAQYLVAHCYMMVMFIFLFTTWTLWIKLDQINSILDINNIAGEKHTRYYYSRIVNRFLWLHGHTLDLFNRLCQHQSDLFSAYMIANFPMNMFIIVTTFIINDDKNNKYNQWKFFATCFIFTQFIGFFVLHLLCSMYTIKIHKCSTKLIYCRIHFPLQPLSLRIRTSLYIEKIHTENRYGFILARATLISMFFFIQFLMFYIQCLILMYDLFNY